MFREWNTTLSWSMTANHYASLHSHYLCEAFLCHCSSRTLINWSLNQSDVKRRLNPPKMEKKFQNAYVPTVAMVNSNCLLSNERSVTNDSICSVNVVAAKSTTWFELFWVPLVPISRKHLWICQICQWREPLTNKWVEAQLRKRINKTVI